MLSKETILEAEVRGLVDKILDPETHLMDVRVCLRQLEDKDPDKWNEVWEILHDRYRKGEWPREGK